MSRHDDKRNENSRGSRWSGGNNEMSNGLFYRISKLDRQIIRECFLTCLPITEMQAIPGARLTMIRLYLFTTFKSNKIEDA